MMKHAITASILLLCTVMLSGGIESFCKMMAQVRMVDALGTSGVAISVVGCLKYGSWMFGKLNESVHPSGNPKSGDLK